MNSGKRKIFDAVELMRSLRDQVFRQIEGMSTEEQLHWLQSTRFDDPTLTHLAQRAARQRAPAGAPNPLPE